MIGTFRPGTVWRDFPFRGERQPNFLNTIKFPAWRPGAWPGLELAPGPVRFLFNIARGRTPRPAVEFRANPLILLQNYTIAPVGPWYL